MKLVSLPVWHCHFLVWSFVSFNDHRYIQEAESTFQIFSPGWDEYLTLWDDQIFTLESLFEALYCSVEIWAIPFISWPFWQLIFPPCIHDPKSWPSGKSHILKRFDPNKLRSSLWGGSSYFLSTCLWTLDNFNVLSSLVVLVPPTPQPFWFFFMYLKIKKKKLRF